MFKTLLTATIAGLFVGAVTAGDTFTALDTDQDGVISNGEALAMPDLIEQWEALDADGSGDLNVEEFAKYQVAEEMNKLPEAS